MTTGVPVHAAATEAVRPSFAFRFHFEAKMLY